MGLLGEIFSAGDGAKRKLRGLLSDPLGELGLLGNRMAEDIQNQLEVYSKAYPLDPRLNPRLDTAQGREMVVDQNVARNKLAEMAANMGMAGTFIGPTARTWDALAAKRAQDLYAKKVDPRIIWKETGTFKGPDGMWRQEIDDSGAKLTGNKLPTEYIDGYGNLESWRLTDSLKHDKLMSAYPESANIRSSFSNSVPEEASYSPALDWISYNERYAKRPLFSEQQNATINEANDALNAFINSPRVRRMDAIADKTAFVDDARFEKVFNRFGGEGIEKKRSELSAALTKAKKNAISNPGGGNALDGKNTLSTTLHELQHAIQQREGWARGGSPDVAFRDPRMWGDGAEGSDIARKMLKDKLKEMSTPMPVEKYAKDAWQSDVVTPEILAAYKDYAKTIKSSARQFETEAQKTVAQEWYRRLAGEAEARATQSRMGMDAAKRREVFPLDSYDVPLNELIIRLGAKP